MSHGIEVDKQGNGSFFSARISPWHKLGIVTPDALTAEDAMKTARLDWTVEKHPIYCSVAIPEQIDTDGVSPASSIQIEVPNKVATVRKSPITGKYETLGVVGPNYTIVQNLETAEFLNALVDESGAHFETAGSLHGGRRTFVSMKLPNAMLIGGSDRVDLNLVCTNAHDGSAALQALVSPVRVVCQNTLNAAIASAVSTIKIRHTSGAAGRVQEARETLRLTFAYQAAFEELAEELLAKPVSAKSALQLVQKIWTPSLDAKGKETKGSQDRATSVLDLFLNADTCEFGRGTGWGLYNAVTEYLDWKMPIQTKGDVEIARANRIVAGGDSQWRKDQALKVLSHV